MPSMPLEDLKPRDRELVVKSEQLSLSSFGRRKLTEAQVWRILQERERIGEIEVEITRRAVLMHYKPMAKGEPTMTIRVQRFGKKAGLAFIVP
jgi:hypothetical protein